MRKPVLRAIGVPSIALVACLAASVSAQEAEATSDQSGEIIVTANKRSENLQDVPISVSAVGGDALEKGRTTQIDELVTKVPNLQLTSTVGENTPIFALRGVSLNDFSLNQSGPVATYYDEVYKGNFALLGIALFDLERVEVLRGPQGTLYGKNTTGGAVNLISRAPKLSRSSFNLSCIVIPQFWRRCRPPPWWCQNGMAPSSAAPWLIGSAISADVFVAATGAHAVASMMSHLLTPLSA